MGANLRFTEEAWREHQAKRARWCAANDFPDQRAKADAPPVGPTGSPAGAASSAPISKYRNERTNGYASKREAKRAAELASLQSAGVISDLQEQVPFLLVPKATDDAGKVVERAATYVADFVYTENGERVCEDCKGMRTDIYILKRKLMLMVHGLRIRET